MMAWISKIALEHLLDARDERLRAVEERQKARVSGAEISLRKRLRDVERDVAVRVDDLQQRVQAAESRAELERERADHYTQIAGLLNSTIGELRTTLGVMEKRLEVLDLHVTNLMHRAGAPGGTRGIDFDEADEKPWDPTEEPLHEREDLDATIEEMLGMGDPLAPRADDTEDEPAPAEAD